MGDLDLKHQNLLPPIQAWSMPARVPTCRQELKNSSAPCSSEFLRFGRLLGYTIFRRRRIGSWSEESSWASRDG